MKKISTNYQFSFKLFPFMFYGIIGFVFLMFISSGAFKADPILLLIFTVMPVVGYFYWKSSIRDLMDEVYDCGDSLLVRKNGEEERIPLANIMNVNFTRANKSSRIILTLVTPGKFGTEITFAPPPQIYFSPNPRNEIAQDLIVRCGQARSAASGQGPARTASNHPEPIASSSAR